MAWRASDADPIFMVGLPRTGSTLVEQILASHSAAVGTMELPYGIDIAADIAEGEFYELGREYLE